jgi:hypothetical protein
VAGVAGGSGFPREAVSLRVYTETPSTPGRPPKYDG